MATPAAASSSAAPSAAAPDDAQLRHLVSSLRGILGPCDDPDLTDDRLLALLEAAERDPNKALDLYFQAKSTADQQHVRGGAAVATPAAADDAQDPPHAPVQAQAQAPAEEKAEALDAAPAADGADAWDQRAMDLSELLGGNVDRAVIVALLQRTNNSLQRAVEVFFAEQQPAQAPGQNLGPSQGAGLSTGENHSAGADAPEVQPVPHPSLEPLTPPLSIAAGAKEGGAAKMKTDATSDGLSPASPCASASASASATYEVTMTDHKFGWQVGNVFGRAVVQWVEPGGHAASAGIHKSDVLLSIGIKGVTEQNCSAIVQELASEVMTVPMTMRLRRAPEQHAQPILVTIPPVLEPVASETAISADSGTSSQTLATGSLVEADGDVVMTAVNGEAESAPSRNNTVKHGFQSLCNAVDALSDAIADRSCENKVIVDLLLRAEFNLDLAVNNYFSETRIVSDFRHIVGYDWDPTNPAECMKVEPYHATIPAGPLGLTVENILERTIVVDIKPGGAAERAAVKRSSWLVSLNGNPITHLTHKETLRMIETVSRPLELELIVVPQEEYRHLRKQLSMNIRQHKTERPVPEQDRMSFRVFQLKIHQAVLMFPKLIVVAMFQHVTSERLAPLSGIDAQDPFDQLFTSNVETDAVLCKEAQGEDNNTDGDMCEERRFLLNMFASIHEYDDKGESIVIRTIQILGWLAKRCVDISRSLNREEESSNDAPNDQTHRVRSRYALLLHIITHILECMSIIENHATWDVMVDAFKLIIRSLSDQELDETITPMVARLSVSPSPTARILPIALLSLVYPRVSTDVRVQLRGMLDRMGNDDNPLVRRAIASIIGDLISAAGAISAHWGVQLLEKATSDSHDIVRIFAVKSCVRLAQDLHCVLSSDSGATLDGMKQTLHLLFCQMVPMVNTFTSDTSWQVRLEAAKSLPAFCSAFGSDYTDVIVDHFVGLVRDPTVEIRRACAEAVFELGQVLIQLAIKRSVQETSSKAQSGPVEQVAVGVNQIDIDDSGVTTTPHNEFIQAAQTKIVRSVLPVTYGLSTDLSVAVRLALAKSIGQALQLLVPGSYDDLAPIFTQMLDETQDANVRAALLEEMARHCDHSSPVIAPLLVPAIQALQTSVQWRIRVKFVECIAAWAARQDGVVVPMEFADATLDMLFDAVHEVRAITCATLPSLVRSVGQEWLLTKAIPKISQCFGSTFNGRVTGLMAIEALANDLKAIGKLQGVLENVVAECTSKVPNLRFRALRSISVLVPFLDDTSVTETTLEFIRPLSDAACEVDVDVRDTAITTIANLEAHLGNKTTMEMDGNEPSRNDCGNDERLSSQDTANASNGNEDAHNENGESKSSGNDASP